MQVDDQFVAFTICEANLTFGMLAVYASTCYIKRTSTWSNFKAFVQQVWFTWCFMGDFNVILGANPATLPRSDF